VLAELVALPLLAPEDWLREVLDPVALDAPPPDVLDSVELDPPAVVLDPPFPCGPVPLPLVPQPEAAAKTKVTPRIE
jgi:hypothetical protein